ncbi:MAG: tetratricopeptide repeat protein [Myxococcaceae bacterium]|jgi:protein O-GlcNAc transferase|nr:tetratricopeptide repeat protein [Myxococcaceae bacterium]MCA3013690.1 tetratricopeptide repeat protein [Myxococcaceae bacterium]
MDRIAELERLLARGELALAACLVEGAGTSAGAEGPLLQARLALAMNELAKTRSLLDLALDRAPKHAYGHLLLGLLHETQGRSDAALLEFQQATRFDLTLLPAWFNQARLLLSRGRTVEAAAAFERAAALDPDNVTVLAAWAHALAKLGQAKRAANVYLRCIEQNVASPFFIVDLAEQLALASEGRLADELLGAGSQRLPSEGLFESKRAALALTRGDLAGAVGHAREAVRRQPECVDFLVGLAVVETARLRLDEARAAAEKALRLAPSSWKALHQLGLVSEVAGHRARAIAFYRRAVEQAPFERAPRNNLAALLLETGSAHDLREAIGLLERLSGTGPLAVAWSHLEAGRERLARAVAGRAARLGVLGEAVAVPGGPRGAATS